MNGHITLVIPLLTRGLYRRGSPGNRTLSICLEGRGVSFTPVSRGRPGTRTQKPLVLSQRGLPISVSLLCEEGGRIELLSFPVPTGSNRFANHSAAPSMCAAGRSRTYSVFRPRGYSPLPSARVVSIVVNKVNYITIAHIPPITKFVLYCDYGKRHCSPWLHRHHSGVSGGIHLDHCSFLGGGSTDSRSYQGRLRLRSTRK